MVASKSTVGKQKNIKKEIQLWKQFLPIFMEVNENFF
jgi:hypothetical protein